MVTAVTGVFALFRDAGLSMVTIQRPTINNEQLSTLFWLNTAVGGALAILSVIAAPIVSTFYREPRLFSVTVALASGFLFNGLGVQHSALLQRRMRFTTLAGIEVVAQIVSISVGITMALSGYGYWALVATAVASPATSTIGFWLNAHWFPGRPHRQQEIGSMIRFGGTMSLNGLIVYVAYNLDKLLLGRVWGAESLGIYGRAYQLINIPTDNLNSAIGAVAVSALSRIQDDPVRFKNYFLKGYSIVAALTIPLTTVSALFAEDIIQVLLGRKWADAAPVFRLLAPTMIAFAAINPLSWVLFSTGRVRRSLNLAFLIAPVVVLAYVVGLPYGPTGVAIGFSTAMVTLAVPLIIWGLHGTGITTGEVLRAVMPAYASVVVAALVGIGVHYLCGFLFQPWLRLSLESGSVLASYVWTLLYFGGQKAFYYDLVQDLMRQSPASPDHCHRRETAGSERSLLS
jgi:PST family polysaccharide transporter